MNQAIDENEGEDRKGETKVEWRTEKKRKRRGRREEEIVNKVTT